VRLNHQIPADLERTINKALEKDRNLRYQHAADLRADLQRLKPILTPDIPRYRAQLRKGPASNSRVEPPLPSAPMEVPQRTSSAAVPVAQPNLPASGPASVPVSMPRSRMLLIVGGVVLAALIAGVFFWVRTKPTRSPKRTRSLSPISSTPPMTLCSTVRSRRRWRWIWNNRLT